MCRVFVRVVCVDQRVFVNAVHGQEAIYTSLQTHPSTPNNKHQAHPTTTHHKTHQSTPTTTTHLGIYTNTNGIVNITFFVNINMANTICMTQNGDLGVVLNVGYLGGGVGCMDGVCVWTGCVGGVEVKRGEKGGNVLWVGCRCVLGVHRMINCTCVCVHLSSVNIQQAQPT